MSKSNFIEKAIRNVKDKSEDKDDQKSKAIDEKENKGISFL